MKNVLFIGAGSMAEAIIAGLVNKEVMPSQNIFVMNKADQERLLQLKNEYQVSIVSEDRSEVSEADLIVLATRPQDIHQALSGVQHLLNSDSSILSVVAGVKIETFESIVGNRPIARSMPNTSATIGKSATGIAFNESVDDTLKKQMTRLLEAIGLVQEVEEEDLHTVTALSGSGPAYVYYLVEAFEEIAVEKGLSPTVARALILQTLDGATSMLRETKEEPAILRENVTSPNGTTFAGLEALRAGDFKELIASCIIEASSRSKELAEVTMAKK